MKISNLLAAAALTAGLALSGAASAVSVGFSNITNNVGNPDLSSQLLMDVSAGTSVAGESGVLFKFTNNVGIASSITQIYFDFGVAPTFVLGSMSISSSENDVKFSMTDPNGSSWPNVPGGSSITPNFTADVGLGADADSPPSKNGINDAADSLTLFALLNPGSFQNLLDALNAGTFRVAMHVQAIGSNDGSDSYVNTVPLPAAAWLFGSALLGFVSFSVRRKA
jgi:hypothetical protein